MASPAPSPTGDKLTDALLPAASRLVGAVHEDDQAGVAAALDEAERLIGDATAGARTLAVLLAAMCPDDTTPAELLAWRRDPDEYHRLRSAGVGSAAARVLASGATPTPQGGAA